MTWNPLSDDRVELRFKHVEGGLVARDGELKGFVIAGEDGKFVPADARIEGERVLVSSPSVAKPAAVRYAWADFPICNLYDEVGLPAAPLRTDSFPLLPDAQ